MKKKRVALILAMFIFFATAGISFAGQATLSWDPPTTNEDGTPLTDLAGYKIYYGISSGNYATIIDVGEPPGNTYSVLNLDDGVLYYFVATAYNVPRFESAYSNEVSKTITSPVSVLTISKNGTGSGTVTSSPAGINCGNACSYSYNSGTIVTLTAAPASGSSFTGWSGGSCSGTGTCIFTLNANATVMAAFALTVNKNSVYRFRNKTTGVYIMTADSGEIAAINNMPAAWTNEGSKFYVYLTQQAGTVPVYRFRNKTTGVYIMTADSGEIAAINNMPAAWTNEGSKFYVYLTQQAGTVPVYRFRNKTTGVYIMTADSGEIAAINNMSATWTNEGSKFYVYLTP